MGVSMSLARSSMDWAKISKYSCLSARIVTHKYKKEKNHGFRFLLSKYKYKRVDFFLVLSRRVFSTSFLPRQKPTLSGFKLLLRLFIAKELELYWLSPNRIQSNFGGNSIFFLQLIKYYFSGGTRVHKLQQSENWNYMNIRFDLGK